ncbi:MAG: hypothetical protein K5894_11570 [Lachnospiraceae bacterium]|nr:hypothetical protein [Lachnospiraceae bacterium]
MEKLKYKKTIGFIPVILAAVLEIIGLVRFCLWAGAHNAFDVSIVTVLLIGIAASVIMYFEDIDFLAVIATACFSYGCIKHLTNQVGSFVDAFQGVNLFGDATQVSNIISIGIILGVGILLMIIASFMKREKTVVAGSEV